MVSVKSTDMPIRERGWQTYAPYFVPLISLILCFLAVECVIRLYHYLRWDISIVDGQALTQSRRTFSSITLDEKLGWRATENYRFDGIKRDFDGKEYHATVSQDSNGFRLFGNVSSGRPRIFVIGDSFTQATDVSDDKTYYAVLKRVLDVEAFGYGVGGYGSLQEFLQFEKYFDLVKPDLIVWQYSTNDLINNSGELESESRINSNGMVRPYLKNDQIEYVLPKKLGKEMRLFSMRYCRLCYLVLSRIDKLNAAKPLDSVEMKTFVGGSAHAVFLESYKVTDDIMRMVRRRAGAVPIVAFIVGTGPPYGSEYENSLMEISRRHDIMILNDVERAVLEKEREKSVVRAGDGAHWNELGHHLAGQALAREIQRVFPSKLRGHHK